MNKRYIFVTAILSLSLLSMAGCSSSIALPTQLGNLAPAKEFVAEPTPVQKAISSSTVDTETLAVFEGTLEKIYEQVNPSVVNIRVVQKEDISASSLPDLPGFPFSEPSPQQPQERYQQGSGSGFVWDKEGHIITNNHVVDGADKIEVAFFDGTTRSAEVIGADPDSDLAVLNVDLPAEQLYPVVLANSTEAKVGQLAIAIGNPFGLEGTMTLGIVSAIGRSLPVESDTQGLSYSIPDVIQTDAPINPGNSGGVLADDQGQVIGVTSAIISPVGASAGIGFAIPSAIVQKVVPGLITNGHYDHPWLGISGTSLSSDLAEAMELNRDQRGALVVDVTADSPADKAGLRGSDRQVTIDGQDLRVGGDVIVAINGQSVKSFDDLVAYLLRNTEVGQTIKLTALRGGDEKTIEAKLVARPEATTSTNPTEQSQAGAWLGILGATITPEVAKAMNLDESQEGILVVEVESGSPADQAGLKGGSESILINGQQVLIGGDVIIAMDGIRLGSIQTLVTSLQKLNPGQEVTLTILREGHETQLKVTLGEHPES